MSTQAIPTVEERIARVRDLDLAPIVFTLTHPEPNATGLNVGEADRLVGLYRQYLILCLRYPDIGIVPSTEIDQAWHTHILDTSKYHQDREEVFGYFLHHFPYPGLRGHDDENRWQRQYATTCELFEHEFGTQLPGAAYSCAPGNHSGFTGMCVEGAECTHLTKNHEARHTKPASGPGRIRILD